MEMLTEEKLEIFVNPGIQHSFLQSLNQIKSKNWEIWTIIFAEIQMEMWHPGVLLPMVNLIIVTYQNVVMRKITRYDTFSITASAILFSIANLLTPQTFPIATFQMLLAVVRFRFQFVVIPISVFAFRIMKLMSLIKLSNVPLMSSNVKLMEVILNAFYRVIKMDGQDFR